jgi:hypothetical protein
LRFVSQKADQQAGEPGPKVEPMRRGAEQRRGQESILAMSDIDEDSREGGCSANCRIAGLARNESFRQ